MINTGTSAAVVQGTRVLHNSGKTVGFSELGTGLDSANTHGAEGRLLRRLLHLATPETGAIIHQPPAVERAAWALAELCAGSAANKAAVLALHGIAPLVWLLDGPAASMATTGAALALQLCLASPMTLWHVHDWVCAPLLASCSPCSGDSSCKALLPF